MKKNLKIKIIVILFVILMISLIYLKIRQVTNTQHIIASKTASLFKTVENSNTAQLTKYIVYGTHLNLEGTIDIPKISGISIDRVHVIIKNIDGDEKIIDSSYDYSDGILAFSTIDKINERIKFRRTINY